MTLRINLNVGGYFLLDEKNNVTQFYAFKSEPEYIAEKIFELERYLTSTELTEILQNMEEERIIINSSLVQRFIREKSDIKADIDISSEDYFKFQSLIPKLLIEHNFLASEQDFHELIRKVNIQLSRKRVAVASQRTDKMIVHAILSLDDLMTTINLFMSRIREWYGIHFPEILKQIENHETLCKIITEMGARENYSEKILENFGFSKNKKEQIINLAKSSMGADFDNRDLQPLQRLANRTLDLFEEKRYLEQWIEEQVDKVAPNMKAVIGAPITARLIALAGGLKEMALMPSSTVQLLGAEKALFRALKTGAKPPKHGVIYQTPELHGCKWWQRGNISRAIAGRLTIAARIDAFQGEYRGNELRMDLEQKIEEIQKKYSEPPKGKQDPSLRAQQKPKARPKRRPKGKGGKRYTQKSKKR
ncbi:MAG: C/D box methylation guide ribonucleoprotein complex aNOP56 subunit [Candidatus Heimdallarchaeaceae archaeon]